jgi:hypothetical protein
MKSTTKSLEYVKSPLIFTSMTIWKKTNSHLVKLVANMNATRKIGEQGEEIIE